METTKHNPLLPALPHQDLHADSQQERNKYCHFNPGSWSILQSVVDQTPTALYRCPHFKDRETEHRKDFSKVTRQVSGTAPFTRAELHAFFQFTRSALAE